MIPLQAKVGSPPVPKEPRGGRVAPSLLSTLFHGSLFKHNLHRAEEALLQLKAAFPGWATTLAGHRLLGWEPAAAGGTGAGSGGGAAGTAGPCNWSFVACDAEGRVVKL